jgi:ATP-dependent Clp protease adaptor protein ClpS
MNTKYEDVELLEDVALEDELTDIGGHSHIIVYNDDVNSFDWVIDSFVDILEHSPDQAEQCAFIIHYKGKATVKTASYNELKPKQEALCDRGLSAVIESDEMSNK